MVMEKRESEIKAIELANLYGDAAINHVNEKLASLESDYKAKEAITYWHPYDFWTQVKEHLTFKQTNQ